jgi:hypothetical protein
LHKLTVAPAGIDTPAIVRVVDVDGATAAVIATTTGQAPLTYLTGQPRELIQRPRESPTSKQLASTLTSELSGVERILTPGTIGANWKCWVMVRLVPGRIVIVSGAIGRSRIETPPLSPIGLTQLHPYSSNDLTNVASTRMLVKFI